MQKETFTPKRQFLFCLSFLGSFKKAFALAFPRGTFESDAAKVELETMTFSPLERGQRWTEVILGRHSSLSSNAMLGPLRDV